YVGIEELPYMPFLSLYLQLGAKSESADVPSKFTTTRNMGSCKRKIEEVLEVYETDAKETGKEFIKKIRLENNRDSDASDSEIKEFREHFQTSLGLFGLSSNIYNCLEQSTSDSSSNKVNDITNSLKHLLSVDPVMGENQETMEIVKPENTELRNENAKVMYKNAKLRQALEEYETRITKLEQGEKISQYIDIPESGITNNASNSNGAYKQIGVTIISPGGGNIGYG
ncbi:15339_t:CDS:2, partial [Racocetra fulgida]